MEQKPRLSKRWRIILIVVVAIAVLTALLVGGAGWLFSRMRQGAAQTADRTEPQQQTPSLGGEVADEAGQSGPVPIYRVAPIDENVINVLLVGTDSRKTSGTQVSGNADTLILASYHKVTQTVTLVSFLRDTVLTIGGLDGEYGKLKNAYTDGGMGMLINTINAFYDLDIQGYVAVGLDGFITFVDETLGGLDIELNQQEIDYINQRITSYTNEIEAIRNSPLVTDPPGMVHLTGAQTLIFVRNRSTKTDETEAEASDFDRVSRQQEVLKLMYHRLVAEKPLSSVPGLIAFAMRHVETNLDADALYQLAEPLMTQPVEIQSVSVPFDGTWRYGGDGSGILFEREPTVARLRELLYGA